MKDRAGTALFIGGLVLAPLVAFSVLWLTLLGIIGVTWLLHSLGLA